LTPHFSVNSTLLLCIQVPSKTVNDPPRDDRADYQCFRYAVRGRSIAFGYLPTRFTKYLAEACKGVFDFNVVLKSCGNFDFGID